MLLVLLKPTNQENLWSSRPERMDVAFLVPAPKKNQWHAEAVCKQWLSSMYAVPVFYVENLRSKENSKGVAAYLYNVDCELLSFQVIKESCRKNQSRV
jgi:hypothetical protein